MTSPNRPGPERANLADYFWSHVTPEPMSGCLLWTGRSWPSGYGWHTPFVGSRRAAAAHRIAWRLWTGHWPPTHLEVCHRCDNPACVNAEGGHLFLGTASDNRRDCMDKRRHPNTAKTTCHFGHQLVAAPPKNGRARRKCPACIRAAVARYTERKKGCRP